jgi:type II secretion system protein N
MAVKLPSLGPRSRTLVRYVGLTLFALVTFVIALQLTFPYDRVKDKIVDALADKYEVTVGGVDRGIMPGRVYFTAVTLRSRPTSPQDTVTTFFIKKLELDAGILSLLGGTLSMDMNAQIGAGTLKGSVSVGKFGKGDIHAHFVGEHLPGDALPMRGVLGLPMTGKIEFDVALGLPMEKSKLGKSSINWQKATGSFSLACPTGCTFGDGVTKLKPLLKNTRNQVMVGEGIDFGKVSMDSLVAKATIKGGKLTLDKFETKSKDGELHVDYAMTLERNSASRRSTVASASRAPTICSSASRRPTPRSRRPAPSCAATACSTFCSRIASRT